MTADERTLVDFDHHSPEFAKDSEDRFPRLRDARCPIGFSEHHGGYWVASSYELVREVLRNDEAFTVERSEDRKTGGKLIPASETAPSIIPGIYDGAAHDRLRRPLQPLFSRASIDELARPSVKRIADELLVDLVTLPSFDFATNFSFRLTVGSILELVGLADEVDDPLALIHMLESAFAIDPEAGADREAHAVAKASQFAEAREMFRRVVRQRAQEPADDLLSRMLEPERQFTEDDVVELGLSMVIGGVRTTAASLDNMIHHLGRDLHLRRQLIADPELIGAAVEELLRVHAATPLVARTATRDVELGGERIRAGDRMAAVLALANLDDQQFPDPLEVKLGRGDGLHMTFGIGIHHCLGKWLALMELTVALSAVLEHMPDYEVDFERARRFEKVGVNNGFAALPVRPNVS